MGVFVMLNLREGLSVCVYVCVCEDMGKFYKYF